MLATSSSETNKSGVKVKYIYISLCLSQSKLTVNYNRKLKKWVRHKVQVTGIIKTVLCHKKKIQLKKSSKHFFLDVPLYKTRAEGHELHKRNSDGQ